METAMLILSILGATVVIAVLLGYLAYLYGKKAEKNEIAEANLEAAKKAKETKEAIKNLSSDELRKRGSKWVRK